MPDSDTQHPRGTLERAPLVSWWFRCGMCGTGTDETMGDSTIDEATGKAVHVTLAYVRKHAELWWGWKHTRKHGWLCPSCAKGLGGRRSSTGDQNR